MKRYIVVGLVILGLAAIGFAGWANVGPASAHPGFTCNPDPGHGLPGCHVDATTTTLADTTTTSQAATTTTIGGTTTTGQVTSTTLSDITSTTAREELPFTGPTNGLWVALVAGLGLIGVGTLFTITGRKARQK